jgi:hypothetical protein
MGVLDHYETPGGPSDCIAPSPSQFPPRPEPGINGDLVQPRTGTRLQRAFQLCTSLSKATGARRVQLFTIDKETFWKFSTTKKYSLQDLLWTVQETVSIKASAAPTTAPGEIPLNFKRIL